MNIDFRNVNSYTDGKAGLMVGLSDQMGLDKVFDKHLTQSGERPPEISYGVLAQMMVFNMADDHHPLSKMAEYYENKDIESLFGVPLSLSQLNDDRFGGFLDLMHQAGPGLIFSEIASNAFVRYGIAVKNINFDTTSKAMWGQYESDEGTEGVIHIDYGYSKQKRGDKKQIKISLGTGNGIVVDGQILSGNEDDKTFIKDNLDRVTHLLESLGTSPDGFCYIADSAAFSKDCMKKAQTLGIHLITRMCDNIREAKAAISEVAKCYEDLPIVEIKKSKGISRYRLKEQVCTYQGFPLKLAVCYSEGLRPAKEKTLKRRVNDEYAVLSTLSKTLENRRFACIEDALIEQEKIQKKNLKKLKYHQVSLTIETENIQRRGRPSLNPEKNTVGTVFSLTAHIETGIERIKSYLVENCIFVLFSSDLKLSAEDILREYKTQSSVEKRFQQLKSPQFVNSLYVESPERVEALGYLMFITLMMLSIAEFVVRRGLDSRPKIHHRPWQG